MDRSVEQSAFPPAGVYVCTHTHVHTHAHTPKPEHFYTCWSGLPRWKKNPPANAGDKDTGSVPGWGRSPGGGHGNPPQYSCLKNSMDRGARRATVHGVTKSWTVLKQLSKHAAWSVYMHTHVPMYTHTHTHMAYICAQSHTHVHTHLGRRQQGWLSHAARPQLKLGQGGSDTPFPDRPLL